MSTRALRRALITVAATALAVTLSACGSSDDPHHGSPMGSAADPGDSSMDHDAMPARSDSEHGLSEENDGYRLVPVTDELAAGRPARFRFMVSAPDGKPLTDYQVDQTVKLHFYAVRSDLTGFQHVHPTLGEDGTWTAPLQTLEPGKWRFYTAFVPGAGPRKGDDLVLSTTVDVPGEFVPTPLPAPTSTTTVDGYTVSLSGDLMAERMGMLTVAFSRSGKAVTDLEPFLATYGHLTAVHEGDLAFAHAHPADPVHGSHGGPRLTFHTEFFEPGDWRLFLQFKAGGTLHTAELTVTVR